MGNTPEVSAACVQGIRFVGHSTGLVKQLRGFRKGQHTVPDAITPTTQAFLAKLCAEELSEDAEALFQKARTCCAYRRKEITMALSSPCALITAKDFSLELSYAFEDDNPSSYRLAWILSGFTELEFLRSPPCDEVFDSRFSELVFSLTKGATVESVIDAVEDLESETLRVDYPSDYSHCRLSVEAVDAQVRFDGTELAMVFQRRGAPSALLEGFLEMRHAFSLTKSVTLSGLFG